MSDERKPQSGDTGTDLTPLHNSVASEVVLEYLKEQKLERRWKTIRRIFITVMIVSGIAVYTATLAGSLGYRMLPLSDSVAVVPINGVIARGAEASADSVITVLDQLFYTDSVKGVILLIDSGGGSPTEAERITRFIDTVQAETGKRVVAACASMCASAAYMIAMHTDKIYAGEYSWTGSIGAIMKGWDFKGALQRFDIDQRVFASGPLKDLMNPYAPMTADMEAWLSQLVNETAETFQAEVETQRGEKLDTADEHLFSGAVWSGRDSLRLGLVDDIGTLETALEREFEGLPARVYRPKRRGNSFFDAILGRIGAGIADALLEHRYEVQL